jgi:hypothetical protein
LARDYFEEDDEITVLDENAETNGKTQKRKYSGKD